MKVRELVEKLNLKVVSGENGLDRDIDGCYVSDLLSDVMAHTRGLRQGNREQRSLFAPRHR